MELTLKKIAQSLILANNPSIKYFAYKLIYGKSEESDEMLDIKKEIALSEPVRRIIANFSYIDKEDYSSFYTDKYKGLVWQLIILAELGADKSMPGIESLCEILFYVSQHKVSGGFSVYHSKNTGKNTEYVLPCLTGNMVYSLIRMGYADDERVKHALQWIINYQRSDDGVVQRPTGWPYDRWKNCWGKHSCMMGVIKALKALAEYPEHLRTNEHTAKINQLVDFILQHHIFKRSSDITQIAKPAWLKLGFPHMYPIDFLEALVILTKLGIKDRRMADALHLLKEKQTKEGFWIMEQSVNQRSLVKIEKKGKASNWLTLHALYVLINND